MKEKYFTLQERWEMDIQAAKDGGTFLASIPQCEECKYWVKGNADQCERFEKQKPDSVLFCEKECPKFEHINIMDIAANTEKKKQLYGGIYGFCVGDALGVPVEFISRSELKKDPVHEMRAYGTYHQYFGTWSDDTSLTLCLIDSLLNGYNIIDIADKYCRYYYEAYWTPYNKVFDIGNTTVQAIQKMKKGVSLSNCGGWTEMDNGNGALMRIIPLAFYLKSFFPTEKIKIIEDVSSLTHAHKRSKLACIIYVEYAMNLLNSIDKMEALLETIAFVKKYCTDAYYDEIKNFNTILNLSIVSLDETKIKSSSYVIDSLEAALWSFLTTENYSDSIFRAINLGGDTDTIAAITGGLSGIFYGIESINNSWIQCLARKKEILELLNRFIKVLHY